MNTIEKIRTEIERRKNYISVTHFAEELLSFLDTLEKEQRPEPYNPHYDEEYLNQKIAKATKSWEGVDVDAMLAESRGIDPCVTEVGTMGEFGIVLDKTVIPRLAALFKEGDRVIVQYKRMEPTKIAHEPIYGAGLTEFEKEVQVASFLEIHPSDEDAIKAQAKHLLDIAYKDLPVWKKVNVRGTSIGEVDGWPALFHDGYVVKICELLKLPREDKR